VLRGRVGNETREDYANDFSHNSRKNSCGGTCRASIFLFGKNLCNAKTAAMKKQVIVDDGDEMRAVRTKLNGRMPTFGAAPSKRKKQESKQRANDGQSEADYLVQPVRPISELSIGG
jgi:hypothetical protein